MCPSELLVGQTGTQDTLSSCQILLTAITKLAHLDQHSHNSTLSFQHSIHRRSRFLVTFSWLLKHDFTTFRSENREKTMDTIPSASSTERIWVAALEVSEQGRTVRTWFKACLKAGHKLQKKHDIKRRLQWCIIDTLHITSTRHSLPVDNCTQLRSAKCIQVWCTVWVKKNPPYRFLKFFSQTVGNF